jgi:hypothetical protein
MLGLGRKFEDGDLPNDSFPGKLEIENPMRTGLRLWKEQPSKYSWLGAGL